MENNEKTFFKNVKLLCSRFDYPESDLRDILVNCNGVYDFAHSFCLEMGIPQKQREMAKPKNVSYPANEESELVYTNPDIQQLHLFFPDMSLEQISTVYWDCGNDMQRAANRILGKEDAYVQDEPKIELEYLQIKYSFIPTAEITATFLRCQNNYAKTDRTIREEYKKAIQLHWKEYQRFEQQNGRYTHRSVVQEHKRLNTQYTSHIFKVESEEEEDRPKLTYDQMEILNHRHQAHQYLETANLLRLSRSEQARTNGRYLTGITNAIKRNEELYNQANRETGDLIFKAHNRESLEYMIEHGHPIDFHGLQVKEAEEYMKLIFSYINRCNKRYRVSIITGSGNHSRNNISLIRQRVISMLQQHRAKYETEGGKIIFSYWTVWDKKQAIVMIYNDILLNT